MVLTYQYASHCEDETSGTNKKAVVVGDDGNQDAYDAQVDGGHRTRPVAHLFQDHLDLTTGGKTKRKVSKW